MANISIAFSPCPNDTFIFDALVHEKIDTEGLHFTTTLLDVQTLNEQGLQGKFDVTKMSYGMLPHLLANYQLLKTGSALGKGVGPLFIKHPSLSEEAVQELPVAIPGENTTAHLLFSLAYPHLKNKVFLRYDAIEQFVQDQKGTGVIIHENRFTYEEKGLEKITDLGDYWESHTQCAIPLGGIMVRRDMPLAQQQKIQALIKKSIEYAYDQYPMLSEYIKCHAQEMSEAVMRQHIDLYVNQYSLDLGTEGEQAVRTLIKVYDQLHQTTTDTSSLFI